MSAGLEHPGTDASTADNAPAASMDDLKQIIRAYNEVTDNLQRSHEALSAEVARLQRELASTDAQLQRSRRLAALGEMAAGIAHEVRNPLAAIGLYANMIAEDLNPAAGVLSSNSRAQNMETARKIAEAVRGLDGIVNDVLTFAREIKPRIEKVSASVLLDRALEAQRPAIEAAGVTVQMQCDGDVTVHGDADLLHQALLNVVRNGVDALAGHTGERVLTLAARTFDSQAVLAVRDTGPGIADHEIDRIFNPFFTTRNTGTGLGLAIVHRIVDAHGGAITAHNDGGAVFELILPGRDASDSPSACDAEHQPICGAVA